MRKFIVLMAVLAMASFAQAGLQLGVSTDGTYGSYVDPVDSEIILMPSETIWIGIHNDTAETGASQNRLIGVVATDPGSWTATGIAYGAPNPAQGSIMYYGVFYGYDLWSFAAGVSTDVYPIGELAGFEFHCDGEGDVQIDLMDEGLGVLDSIIIHQIPEPMTMALLGLGGLFLRRRRA